MIPIAVSAKATGRVSGSFASERTDQTRPTHSGAQRGKQNNGKLCSQQDLHKLEELSGWLSLKLPKSSLRSLKPACWIAVAGCILSAGCKQSTLAPAPPPPPVTVATPIHKEIVEWDEDTGRTQAIESVQIRPRVSGYIDQITFKEGQLVKPGDVLFVVDQRPYRNVLDQDKANLQRADAKRQLNVANFARAEQLFQNKVSSTEEFDTKDADRNEAQGEVAQAQASLNSAQLNRDFTEVKSPILGRI